MLARRGVFALCAVAFCLPLPHVAAAEEQEMVLFSFDDHSIPWRDNLKLTLVPPKKYPGNPILEGGPQGSVDDNGLMLYGTVFKDGGKLRMWYIAQPQPDPRYRSETYSPRRPIAYAESTDGIHWQKPDLGLVEYHGNRHNNIVLIEPADHPMAVTNDYVSVLRDESDADASRRYKMVYIAYLPKLRHSTAVTANSPDGLRWTLASTEEFTKGHFENTSLTRFGGLYYVTGQNLGRAGGHLPGGLDAGRAMTCFFSPDFRHWSGERALSFFRANYEPALESFGHELHMGVGVWNRGNVIVGLYGRWHGNEIDRDPEKRKIAIMSNLKISFGLAISNDAIHYREPITDADFVVPGQEGEWDSHGLLQGQAYHNTDTETYIWYSDWYTRNPFPTPLVPNKASERRQAIGLMTMRRDGFAFLSKHRNVLSAQPSFYRTDTRGSLLTDKLKLERAAKLLVNVDQVTADAPLLVSVVDDAERPLDGYPVVAVKQNGPRVPVIFGDNKQLPVGKKFRIRIEWPDAPADPHFYAMYFER